MDDNGRPTDSGFFTGLPSYYDLKYQMLKILNTKLHSKTTEVDNSKLKLVKKSSLENLLDSKITDRQVIVHNSKS